MVRACEDSLSFILFFLLLPGLYIHIFIYSGTMKERVSPIIKWYNYSKLWNTGQ